MRMYLRLLAKRQWLQSDWVELKSFKSYERTLSADSFNRTGWN